MGAMLKSMQVTGDQSVKMSTDLAGLAGDFASFYNLDHDDAWEKIRSGIAGETEPLKQLGINMSQANLDAYALKEGLGKTYAQMSQSEQTILRYKYLMSVTSDAQGDFARTSGSWANQLRTAKLNVENMSASIGKLLVPSLTGVLQTFNKVAEESGGDARVFISNLDKVVEAGAQAAREMLPIVTSLMKDVLNGIVKVLPDLIDMGGEIVTSLVEGLINGLPQIASALGQLAGKIASMIPELVGAALMAIPDIVNGFVEGLFGIENPLRRIKGEMDQLNDAFESSRQAYVDSSAAASAAAGVNKAYADELYNLIEKEGKTADEKERIKALVDLLNESMPILNLHYDEQADAVDRSYESTMNLISSQEKLAKLEGIKKYTADLATQIYSAEQDLNNLADTIKKTFGVEVTKDNYKNVLGAIGTDATYDVLRQYLLEYQTMVLGIEAANQDLSESNQDVINQQKEISASTQKATEEMTVAWDALSEDQKAALEGLGVTQETYVGRTQEQLDKATQGWLDYQDAVAEYSSKLEESEKKHNDAMGTIYDEGLKTQDISLEKATKNLENQVKEYENYRENLRAVMSKVPGDVYEYLVGLGPEAAGLVAEMTTASQPELDAFVGAVRAKGNTAYTAAVEEVGKIPAYIPTMGSNLKVELSKINLNPDAVNVGKEITNGVFDGMTINLALKAKDAAKKVYDSIMGGLKNMFGIHSRSKRMYEEIGFNLALGQVEGYTENVEKMNSKITHSVDSQIASIAQGMTLGAAAQYNSSTYYQPTTASYSGNMVNIEKYIQNTKQDAKDLGYIVETGRREAAFALGVKPT